MKSASSAAGESVLVAGFRSVLTSWLTLPLCIVVGVLARFALIILIPVDPVSDADWYFHRAGELAAGLGYQEDGLFTAYWPVGYPAFLAGLFKVFGPSVLVAQIANVAFWAATLFLLHDIVRRISARIEPANLAAITYSVYLNAVGYSALLLTETLFTFLLLLCCWAAVARRGWGSAVICGVVLGLMTLVKAQTWLFGLAWAGAIVFLGIGVDLKQRIARAALMVVLMFAVVLPWSLRNLEVFGSFVLVSTNGGISFAVGNHPNGDGKDAWESSPYREQIGKSVADQIGSDRRAKEITWRWIRQNPIDFLKLAPSKFYWAILPDGESEWGFQEGYPDYERHRVAFRTARWANQLFYFALLGATLGGIVWMALRRDIWATSKRPLLLFSAAYLATFAAVTFVFNGQSRYHYPMVPLMCGWVALAWWSWRSRIGRGFQAEPV